MATKRHSPHASSSSSTPPHPEVPDDAAFAAPSPEPRPMSNRSSTQDGQRIGDILRRVREHRGEDIESISDYLRIRPNYLIALENSQYEDLPADAYVIGFLRTYALYLGLDGRGAIDQYRREMAGRRKKPQLSMPQPMSEGQAPTIALLVGAAIAAILIYALWYGLSTPDKEVTEQPLSLPQTAQEISASKTAASTTTQNAGITLTATSTGAPLQDITPVIIQQPEANPEEAGTDKKSAKDDSKDKSKDKEKDSAKKPEAPAAITPAPLTPVGAPVAPLPETKTDKDKKAEETKQPAAANDDAKKSPLVIRADKESWVLITDSKGETVFDRTLKAGEIYQVPSAKGLKLTTGNASDISFMNEGKELPRLKSSGPVLRAISLEPDKLKARLTPTPAENSETPPAQ
ncbi:MAG TPA: hypothetical protein DCY07_01765 [Rhodospirillaceae bacterium]|nr:hypothetical protein [Rhodospirillaceae bacterium]